jgi:hypothetical protein
MAPPCDRNQERTSSGIANPQVPIDVRDRGWSLVSQYEGLGR